MGFLGDGGISHLDHLPQKGAPRTVRHESWFWVCVVSSSNTPNTALARKNDSHDSPSSQRKRHLQ